MFLRSARESDPFQIGPQDKEPEHWRTLESDRHCIRTMILRAVYLLSTWHDHHNGREWERKNLLWKERRNTRGRSSLLMPAVKVLAAASESVNQTDEGTKRDSFTASVFCHFFFHDGNAGFLKHNPWYRSYSKQTNKYQCKWIYKIDSVRFLSS